MQALVVEDAPELRVMLVAALRHAGFAVTALADGDRAVEESVRVQPDVVCLDIVLPTVGGLDVCEALRRTPAVADVPVIITSARGSALDRAEAERAGADDFVVKPVDPLLLGMRARALAVAFRAARRRADAA